jgi:hypothetical protein
MSVLAPTRTAAALSIVILALSCGKRDDEGADDGGISVTITASGDGDGDGEAGDGDGERFDVAGGDVGGGGNCDGQGGGMMGEEYEFINLWVANSPQDTVSKIDTKLVQEVARYASGPVGADPSRTSVNLNGDMVVVNRGGSITKYLGRSDLCPEDNNGQAGLQTSTGANDVLPFMSDDCMDWHVDLPAEPSGAGNPLGPRPVAWEAGELDQGTCYYNPRLWVGWYDGSNGQFRRMNGQTGATMDELTIPWNNGLNWGPYGGAVNQEGDFWVIGWQLGPLIKIHEDGVNYDRYEVPNPPSGQKWTYGMALDEFGRPWIASAGNVLHFDPASSQFSWITTSNQSMRGVGADREGRVWLAVDATGSFGCGLAVVDYNTKQLTAPALGLPGCGTPVGVSVDAEGYVWVVDQAVSTAFKVDGDTFQIAGSVGGLMQPYTYSDMTGAGLGIVTNPPQG